MFTGFSTKSRVGSNVGCGKFTAAASDNYRFSTFMESLKRARALESDGGVLFRSIFHRQLTGCKRSKQQKHASIQEWKQRNEYFCGNTSSVPLLAVKFCRDRTSGHLLAVVDEKGVVTVIDSRPNATAPFVARHQVHDNAGFDICWSVDSTRIATASGDYSVCVLDAVTGARYHKLKAHFGSVKVVQFANQSSDILVSGGRDGAALMWDLRMPAVPALSLRNIHVPDIALKATPRSRRSLKASASVTSAAFLHDDNILLTGGGSDGEVKMWDRRSCIRKHPKESQVMKKYPIAGRSYGVVALDVSLDGRRILASYADSIVHVWDALYPDRCPIAMLAGHRAASFYPKAAFAPDGHHIAGGSSDRDVFIWDIQRLPNVSDVADLAPSPPQAIIHAHTREVGGVAWSLTEENVIASCADDCMVKLWHADWKLHGEA